MRGNTLYDPFPKSNGKRFDGFGSGRLHQGHDCGGIDSPGQQGSQLHIRDHALAHRMLKDVAEFILRFLKCAGKRILFRMTGNLVR